MSVISHSRRVCGIQQAETENPHPPRRATRQSGFPGEKRIFLTYRAANTPWVLAIYLSHTQHSFNAFLDHDADELVMSFAEFLQHVLEGR